MSLRHDSVALAAITVLQKHLKLLEGDAREVVMRDLLALREESGVKSASIMLPTGEVVGQITLTQPSVKGAYVHDADALLAYAKSIGKTVKVPAHDELAPGFLADRLPYLHDAGDGYACDDEGTCIPGVKVDNIAPEPKAFSITKLGSKAIAAAWRRGELVGFIASSAFALADGKGDSL